MNTTKVVNYFFIKNYTAQQCQENRSMFIFRTQNTDLQLTAENVRAKNQ